MCDLCTKVAEMSTDLEAMKMAMLAHLLILPMSEAFRDGASLPELSPRVEEHSKRTGEAAKKISILAADIHKDGAPSGDELARRFTEIKAEVDTLVDVGRFFAEK